MCGSGLPLSATGASGNSRFAHSRQRMFAVMRAEPLDKDALQRAMADVRVKTTELQALLQSALAASVEQAPASERQKIQSPGLGLLKGF